MNAPLRPFPKLTKLPPLQNGDRLTRDEFERRYWAMPPEFKAELIDGEVHVSSPVSPSHGGPHIEIATWVGNYKASTSGVDAFDNTTVRLDAENEPQPDISLVILPEHGDRVTFDEDDFIAGAADLVVEVSVTSASIDLNKKFEVYRRNQVREYIVWRVFDEALDWFVYRRRKFELLAPEPEEVLKSVTFPGLWLDPAALLRRDLAAVLATLNKGLASPEHAAFVAKLRQAAQPTKK